MTRTLPPFAAVRAFEATARHCSMQAASEELSLTPSAISHQVKALETFVGTALFERKPGRLALTPTGSTYLKDLRQILDLFEAATARATRRGQSNHITVHMSPSLAEHWFVPLLREFHEKYPDVRISVVCGGAAADFASGIADVSVVYDRIRAELVEDLLFTDEIAPCCSESFLRKHGPLETPEQILEYPLIWCESDPDEWRLWFKHVGLGDAEPVGWISFDLRASTLQAAREGLGLAMGRRPYVDLDIHRPRLVRPIGRFAPTGYGYYVETAKRAVHLNKIKLFKSWLTSTSQSIATQPE